MTKIDLGRKQLTFWAVCSSITNASTPWDHQVLFFNHTTTICCSPKTRKKSKQFPKQTLFTSDNLVLLNPGVRLNDLVCPRTFS